MAALIHLVSLSMGLHLCCLESLALLQVRLGSRTSKSSSLGDVLALIKRQFHAPTYQVNM
jgi:ABC-type microcin C transport system permease subunit YejE